VTFSAVIVAVNLVGMMLQIVQCAFIGPDAPIRASISAAFVVMCFWAAMLNLMRVGP
jgi:hypothetical protein